MRILGNLVQFDLITSESFCQMLLNLVEDFVKLPHSSNNAGALTHSADLILETVLAALPQTH